MRSVFRQSVSTVEARVEDVLPQLGVAYVVDDTAHAWGVTRGVSGGRFDELAPGQRVRLQLQGYPSFSVVSGCELLG